MTYDAAYDSMAQAGEDDINFTFERSAHPSADRVRSTILIWRVEGPEREGFYRGTEAPWIPFNPETGDLNPYFLLGLDAANELERQPLPCIWAERSRPNAAVGDHLCEEWEVGRSWSGFNSLSQARRWFSRRSWTDTLGQHGWYLVAYLRSDLAALAVGRTQVVFDPPAPGTRCAHLNLRVLHQLSTAAVVAMALGALQ